MDHQQLGGFNALNRSKVTTKPGNE